MQGKVAACAKPVATRKAQTAAPDRRLQPTASVAADEIATEDASADRGEIQRRARRHGRRPQARVPREAPGQRREARGHGQPLAAVRAVVVVAVVVTARALELDDALPEPRAPVPAHLVVVVATAGRRRLVAAGVVAVVERLRAPPREPRRGPLVAAEVDGLEFGQVVPEHVAEPLEGRDGDGPVHGREAAVLQREAF